MKEIILRLVATSSGNRRAFYSSQNPRKSKDFRKDGEWAYVEGSGTGVPVKELIIENPPPISCRLRR